MRVFITGAGSGFGFELARRLALRGEAVVATDAEPDGLTRLVDELGPGSGLVTAVMDVRDAGAVRRVTADALASGPVDLLVNDAGFAVFGAQAEADLSAVQAMLDTNVIGLARVTQALLPSLRAQRGTVVQLSSVAGRMVFPESGFYAASKHAVEALSEALFLENCRFGLRVVVVEPGSFQTGFQERARRASQPRSPDSPYAEVSQLWDRRRSEVLEPAQLPAMVVDAILAALADERPFMRVSVGADAERLLGLRQALGLDGWVAFLAQRYGGWGGPGELHDPVGSPERVIEGGPSPAVQLAWENGHLGHWEETEAGRAALRLLRR